MRYKIPKEFEVVRKIEFSKRLLMVWMNGNGHEQPEHTYIGRVIDSDRASPDFGKQVMTQYRFVHGDGYEVCMRVPVDFHNPFVKADLRIKYGG